MNASARKVARSPSTWVVVAIAISVGFGLKLQRDSPEVFLGAAPFVARDPRSGWHFRFGWGLVGAAFVGAIVTYGTARSWWWRLRLRSLMVCTALATGVFGVLLALSDGTDGLLHGASDPTEYLSNLASAPPAGEFVRHFVDDIDRYSVHVRGHPPGFVLVLKVLHHAGLTGAWPVVALSIIAAAVTPIAVVVAVWRVAGSDWARRCTPLLVVAPYALWMITSADAVYAATGAWGVATFVLGVYSRGWRSVLWGACSGALLGALLFMTYGGAVFLLVPLVAAVFGFKHNRRNAMFAIASATAVIVGITALFAVTGFWWLAGATETKRQYWAGTAQFRPFAYFAIANLAVSAVAIGPAGVAGMNRLWRQRRTVGPIVAVVAAGALALLVAHLSQYSRGEVERIWLLFFPWLLVAGAMLVTRTNARTAAIAVGAQTIVAVLLQAMLVSKW